MYNVEENRKKLNDFYAYYYKLAIVYAIFLMFDYDFKIPLWVSMFYLSAIIFLRFFEWKEHWDNDTIEVMNNILKDDQSLYERHKDCPGKYCTECHDTGFVKRKDL